MATFTWNTNSGDFGVAANWGGQVPGTADTADFATGSGTISGTGNVSVLQLDPTGGPWIFTGSVTAKNFNVNATTSVQGGAWVLAGTPNGSNYAVIGSGTGGIGNLTISGGGSLTSTQTASTSSFGLYVGSGSATTANGTLTVSGAGSTLNTGLNGASVGQAGTGTMTVTGGASAAFSTSDSSAISALSVGRSGSGTVNVAGGSSLTANGFVYIGRAGAGVLSIDGGSTFTGGSAASGSVSSYGVVIGDGSPATNSSGQPNNPVYFGGSGTATVTNSSTLHSLASIFVGNRGTAGKLTIDTSSTAHADASVVIGNGTDRTGGSGTVIVQGGGVLQAGTVANGSGSLILGNNTGTTGTLTVTGSTSRADTNGFRLTVGSAGTGTLTISGGGTVTSASTGYTDAEAALAVAGSAGSTGTVTITGAGSTLSANGVAVIGGNNKGTGVAAGGAGTVNVRAGGTLATGAMTIQAGSTLSVDQASTLNVPTITLNGGTADLYTLSNATGISFGVGGTLKVHAITGTNTLTSFGYGDAVDFVGVAPSAVTLTGTSATGLGGTLNFSAAPANASYKALSDGAGGTIVTLTPKTIGVYRFFDTQFGTHFYTADATEAANVQATRPDLKPEGPNGIGLQAVSTSANDPNAAAVYRFFDNTHGTHFFTASASERDSVIANRSDLVYEPTSTFYEHTASQPGDIPVYRYFDKVYGTHFYTDSASEKASIDSTRADLVYEGIGFYEPVQNNMTGST